MKTHQLLLKSLLFILGTACIFSCEKESDMSDKFEVSISENSYVPGGKIAYNTTNTEFALKYSPLDMGLKKDLSFQDNGDGYWIAENELRYKLWEEIYNWAQANDYNIACKGQSGSNSSFGDDHPVTRICWRDAVVWCNALTEYYNSYNGDKPDYEFAYTSNGEPVRNSELTNEKLDDLIYHEDATGFRLPTNEEWYLAAKYQNTPDDYASGASDNYKNENANTRVAWYRANSNEQTHPVKTKLANPLGLYDMSGNISEIVFDKLERYNGKYNIRGGAWNSNPEIITISSTHPVTWHTSSGAVGFRIARTLGNDHHKDIDTEENDNNNNNGESEGNGSFTYKGNTYSLAKAFLYNFNTVGAETMTLELVSENISQKFENNGGYTGTGDMLEINFFMPQETLNDGDVFTTENMELITVIANTGCNTDIFPYQPTSSFMSGEEIRVSVSKSGDEYTIEFTAFGLASPSYNECTLTGTYQGTILKLDAGIDF